MSRRDDETSLRQMAEHAEEAVRLAEGRTRDDLDRDRPFTLAIWKLVEIVGEAARRVSPSTREIHQQIPWKEIVGTRDRLVHGYDEVDYDVLWRIVHDELPPLISELLRILD